MISSGVTGVRRETSCGTSPTHRRDGPFERKSWETKGTDAACTGMDGERGGRVQQLSGEHSTRSPGKLDGGAAAKERFGL